MIGTRGEGNVFPGPSAPFGMLQLSPDTDTKDWNTDSGYEYDDPTIMGFSLTHLSGTGCPDLGDFLFVPQTGDPALVAGDKKKPGEGYQSPYSHEEESASAGYYRVKLRKSGVTAELTAVERGGVMRFTFPAAEKASVLCDLTHVIGRAKVAQARVRVLDDRTITGFHLVNSWAKDREIHFAARFSRPFDKATVLLNDKPVVYDTYRFRSAKEVAGEAVKFLASYDAMKAGEVVDVRVAISSVSAEGALANLEKEVGRADFDAVRERVAAQWDRSLAAFAIDAPAEQKTVFYSALYHTLLTPNLRADVDGRYRGNDREVRRAEGFSPYTIFSLWDTFRAEHPLLALIEADRDADMVRTMIEHGERSVDRLLPVWELQGSETWCMIGYPAVPVIVDAYFRGVKMSDPERAYAAVLATVTNPDYDSVAAYDRLGWVPCDKENESLSKTLEYAYQDWCVARFAKALGKEADHRRFMRRAGAYANLFDEKLGWMRSRDSKGAWREPFDVHAFGGGGKLNDVTEGTSTQYSWFVPHDVDGLIRLMGGREKFLAKLDAFFDAPPPAVFNSVLSENDRRGCIGEYWHGNEPVHHVAYLYSCAGAPARAAERLRSIVDRMYGVEPGSLCGNDDCGQMSAWYVFTCLGFYPVSPGGEHYVIGAPQVASATMRLSNGKVFRMVAGNLSKENRYVRSVKLDGKPLDSVYLPCSAVMNGGLLEFEMGRAPSDWGTTPVPQKQ